MIEKYAVLVDFMRRTLPFIAVGVTFMCLAYTYGKTSGPLPLNQSLEIVRLCSNCAP